MSKFEKLLDLLVNEQKDEAEKVFHEIVVEKSRQIYEGILAEEEATDETADNVEAEEVDEAAHEKKDKEKVNAMAHGDKKDKDKKTLKAAMHKEDAGDDEEKEEPAESTDETIEEIGGDQTDDLLNDIEAEGDGMDMDDEDGMDHDGEFDDDGDMDKETEDMFEPLEKELDQLKAEFASMMDKDDDKPEESAEEPTEEVVDEPATFESADKIVKEYAEMVKMGHGAEKMGKETGADEKKGPVAQKNTAINASKAVDFSAGGDEKGGVGKSKMHTDTAKPMGGTFANSPKQKNVKGEKAPAPMTTDTNKSASPVASK